MPRPRFEEVAGELSGPLLRYLERLTGDPVLAHDLHQETLVRIARSLDGFEGRSSLRTWSFSIASRVAVDHYRCSNAGVDLVPAEEMPEAAEADAGPDPDERLVVGEMNACIRRVVDDLPADYRTALVLHDLEGMTAPEVARVCGCSVETAKIRIHRARRRLRQALESECTFYRDRNDVLRCDRK